MQPFFESAAETFDFWEKENFLLILYGGRDIMNLAL